MKAIGLLVAALLLASPAGAQTSAGWALPRGTAPLAFPGQALTVRSAALGRDVVVRISVPQLTPPPFKGAIVYALVDPHEAERLAADLRQRELEISTYGVVVVTIERPRDYAVREVEEIADFALTDYLQYDGTTITVHPGAFEKFLYEELAPLIDAEWPVAGERILAGDNWGGGFVLRMAAKRPTGFDHHVVLNPRFQPNEAAAIFDAGVETPEGFSGKLDVTYSRDYGLSPEDMERLLGWLQEQGHSVGVSFDADDTYIADVVAGSSRIAPW